MVQWLSLHCLQRKIKTVNLISYYHDPPKESVKSVSYGKSNDQYSTKAPKCCSICNRAYKEGKKRRALSRRRCRPFPSQQAPVVVAQPTPKMDSAAPAEKSFGSDQRKTFSYRANSSIFIRKVYYIIREEGNNHDIYLICLLRK